MHPAINHVLQFFEYKHLPTKLQDISRPFRELAFKVANDAPENQETTVALRKLLEAKDAAVRASLMIGCRTLDHEKMIDPSDAIIS